VTASISPSSNWSGCAVLAETWRRSLPLTLPPLFGARLRATVGWRISDAPGVPPSPRSRGEAWGEGRFLRATPDMAYFG